MRKKPKIVAYRRKREGKTNYAKRKDLLAAGKPRLVIRPTLNKIIVQVIEFQPAGDKIILGIDSRALEKFGWKASKKNLPAAYLTGYLLGKRVLEKGVKEAVLDIGQKPSVGGNKIFACLKGAVDAGLQINHDEKILPSPERISGKSLNLEEMFKQVKEKLK